MLTLRFCRAYPALMAGLKPRHVEIGGAGGGHDYEGYELPHLQLTIGGTATTLDSLFVFRQDSHSSADPFYGNLAADVAARFGGFTIDFRSMMFRLGIGDP
jgi:hypothetical protein